jgi:L-ascorbate metabolism protein UlaG (beta-lactamase superfamily)
MEIVYLGHSSFRIKTKTASIITDPYSSEMLGFKFPKVEADIVTVSHEHQDHNNLSGVGGEPFTISFPGEYEVKGVSIFGYSSFHDAKAGEERGKNIIYVIEAEDLKIAHLGDLRVLPEASVLEEIAGVDILMIPVGGEVTLGPEQASELIGKIEPSLVLPMHYKAEGIDEAQFRKLVELKEFLVQMGAEQAEKLDKLSISKDKLPQETKVIVLERKS